MTSPFSRDSDDSPLSMADWWLLWQALDNPEADRQAARDVLGSLVSPEWMHDAAMACDTSGDWSNRAAAIKAAREACQDSWIAQRCDLGIGTLQRLRNAERPYHHARLDFAARVLLLVITDLFRLSDQRETDTVNQRGKEEQR
ncbi:hypothetical protein ACFS2C_23390 [Prauserella oleivorans]|uniref:DUF222 domain-containing protein n=1 Tax=Prauserella oleivorans TaxID=1478153 RepID=A0ABW5WEB5_9PSEU